MCIISIIFLISHHIIFHVHPPQGLCSCPLHTHFLIFAKQAVIGLKRTLLWQDGRVGRQARGFRKVHNIGYYVICLHPSKTNSTHPPCLMAALKHNTLYVP